MRNFTRLFTATYQPTNTARATALIDAYKYNFKGKRLNAVAHSYRCYTSAYLFLCDVYFVKPHERLNHITDCGIHGINDID